MFIFHFSYKDPSKTDKFLRGHNISLHEDDIKKAIDEFNTEKPGCSIEGVLKTKKERHV